MTSYVKFQDKPGVFPDDTPLTASVFYVTSNQIRFERGKWQTRGGWEKATTDLFEGICRGLFVWRNASSQPLAAIGTHTNVHALFDADLYDITPVVEIGVLTNPFTTTLGSAVVTVTDASHGLTEGSDVRFDNATAVGGITIDGRYEITEVTGVNTYTITHSSPATSGASGGGTVDYDYFLPIGLVDGLLGTGFGVGAFGLGDFGEPTAVSELYPRTWSLDNWGSNLVGNPRGLGLYEWAPTYANPELVTNGTFAAGTDWTLGAGWSIAGGAAVCTTSGSGLLSQELAVAPSSYCLLEFDVTRVAGTVTPQFEGTAIGTAISATGRYRRSFYAGAVGDIQFSSAAFGGTVDNVSVTQMLEMIAIPSAPAQNTCMIVTPEDMIMVGGTIDEETAEFDPLLVRWCARRNNQLWTPGYEEGNTSGSKRLAKGSRIVKMLNVRGEILILTDAAAYVARFNIDPTVNYTFTPLGGSTGLIGANAAIFAGGVPGGGAAFWVGAGGEIMRYAGGTPEQVPCTARRDFIDNLARAQHDKIYMAEISTTTEIQVLYPDSRDGNECSRYIKLNWGEAEPCWDVGLFARSAWIDTRAFGYPLGADLDGQLFYQEKGNSADGEPLSGFIETGAFSLRDGRIASILGVIPDFEGLLGGLEVTVKTWLNPQADPTVFGPYPVTAMTEKLDVRTQGRQIAFRYEWEAAPAFARAGTMQVDVRHTGCGR